MASTAPTTLLPAFDPLPPVSFTDDSTPTTSPVASTFAEQQPLPAKHSSSGSGSFFTRARSASFHNSTSPVSAFFRRDEEVPPVPSLPSTPGRDFGFSSTSLPVESSQYPPIKSVTVPHHSKAGKSWVFACRVVPEAAARPPLTSEGSSSSAEMVRRESLGKMELAGKGVDGAREPHTVWRTWPEFVEFSSRLSAVFPHISPSSPSENASPEAGVPRLSKNRTFLGVMTSKTLSQRQADLDTFVRCLFDTPEEVKCSAVVRDFFRLREEDLSRSSGAPTSMSPPMPSTNGWGEVDQDGPDSFSSFLAQANSPNATVRPAPTKRRPALAVKVSMPDMRGIALANDFEQHQTAARRAATDDIVNHLRTSNYSVSTNSSASSSVTVTPQSMFTSASHSSLKKPSPLGAAFRFGGSAPLEEEPAVKVVKKRPSLGRLRHFRSLQDLRQQSSTPAVPTEPMPKLGSIGMLRAVTQPHPFPPPSPAVSPTVTSNSFPFSSAPSVGPSVIAPPMSRNRSGSRSSSASSFEDLWGGSAYMSPNPSSQSSVFRHGPSGRLDRVPETAAQRPRRPSMPSSRHTAGSIGTKASCGHSSTPSVSSIGSNRSSNAGSSLDLTRSMSDFRSRRSSTDYSFSDGGSLSTPPTPHSEFGSSSKYFIENGQLSQNNKVPLPPFFPVPPTMSSIKMDATHHSHDGISPSPRHSQGSNGHNRKSSLEMVRPRTSSTSSRRQFQQSPLDTILASPKYQPSSTASACSSPSPQSPQDRPYLTFKLLHPEANLVLRAPRVGLSLASLRTQVRDKFAASNCSVQLETEEAHWGLVWTAPASEGSSTRLLITEEDFVELLERTATLEKVALRIVS